MADTIFIEGSGCECDVTLDRWLKDALPMMPGIVRGVAARELVLACREFFERSFAWQTLIEDQNLRVGRRQYWLSPLDQYTNVIGVLGVAYKGTWLPPAVHRPIRSGSSSGDTPQTFYASEVPDAVELYPDPTTAEDGVLDFLVALTPKVSVEHLPRVAEIKYFDAILDGFLARVYSHPRKPYTDHQLAAQKRRSFNAWIGRYAGQAKQGYLGAQNWRFPSGWGVSKVGRTGGVA